MYANQATSSKWNSKHWLYASLIVLTLGVAYSQLIQPTIITANEGEKMAAMAVCPEITRVIKRNPDISSKTLKTELIRCKEDAINVNLFPLASPTAIKAAIKECPGIINAVATDISNPAQPGVMQMNLETYLIACKRVELEGTRIQQAQAQKAAMQQAIFELSQSHAVGQRS